MPLALPHVLLLPSAPVGSLPAVRSDPVRSRPTFVCHTRIDKDEYGQCVVGSCNKSLGVGNPCLPSDYRRSQYVALNWAKWPLFIDTLRVARTALWLEADVVILRNPWEVLLAQAELYRSVHDAIRYQYEAPPCTMPTASARVRVILLFMRAALSSSVSSLFSTSDWVALCKTHASRPSGSRCRGSFCCGLG